MSIIIHTILWHECVILSYYVLRWIIGIREYWIQNNVRHLNFQLLSYHIYTLYKLRRLIIWMFYEDSKMENHRIIYILKTTNPHNNSESSLDRCNILCWVAKTNNNYFYLNDKIISYTNNFIAKNTCAFFICYNKSLKF